jgi:hypothetical protein
MVTNKQLEGMCIRIAEKTDDELKKTSDYLAAYYSDPKKFENVGAYDLQYFASVLSECYQRGMKGVELFERFTHE